MAKKRSAHISYPAQAREALEEFYREEGFRKKRNGRFSYLESAGMLNIIYLALKKRKSPKAKAFCKYYEFCHK